MSDLFEESISNSLSGCALSHFQTKIVKGMCGAKLNVSATNVLNVFFDYLQYLNPQLKQRRS